jgi:hypothetical protein
MSNGPENPGAGEPRNTPGELPPVTRVSIEHPLITRLVPSAPLPARERALWAAIKNRASAIDFIHYQNFVDRVLCQGNIRPDTAVDAEGRCGKDRRTQVEASLLGRRGNLLGPIHGVDAYNLLRVATEAFLLMECGVFLEDPLIEEISEARLGEVLTADQVRAELEAYLTDHLGVKVLPYLKRILDGALAGENPVGSPYCFGVIRSRLACPCLLELIWSYWLEEGMLVQSISAISLRFQNKRRSAGVDPLAHLDIDPLRPLGNLFWGFIQDEPHRLSLVRRAYEYDHQYGITLYGKAAPRLRPADSRSKFLEGFHNLLYLAAVFFKEEADTMVIPDGFPMLNALKEVHLLLAQGMHNQFGDLPWTTRVEMLIMQWLLARPEIRDFLRGRPMVPYSEAWMPQVDAMKSLQGWTDTTVTHFRNLAAFGEVLLLSVRFTDWIDIAADDVAKSWAHYWKPEIQGYIHAYRAVTGVDLTVEPVNYTLPAELLMQRRGRSIPNRFTR